MRLRGTQVGVFGTPPQDSITDPPQNSPQKLSADGLVLSQKLSTDFPFKKKLSVSKNEYGIPLPPQSPKLICASSLRNSKVNYAASSIDTVRKRLLGPSHPTLK